MREIFQTDDLAEIALLKSLFKSAGIQIFLFDELASANLGSFGAWTPCRIMVSDSDYEAALDVLDSVEWDD